MLMKPTPPMSLELAALLEKVKGYKMTKAERDAQRKSWVVGNMMLSHPEMTREEVVAIYDGLEPEAE